MILIFNIYPFYIIRNIKSKVFQTHITINYYMHNKTYQ